MTAGLLEISPTDLKFRFELRKQIPSTLSLINHGDKPVAFKVKTTSPKKYCVRPNTGVVVPGGQTEVQVIMQSQREVPADQANCKDKFLVQSTIVGQEMVGQEVTSDVFSKKEGREIHEAKLRVVYLQPPPPPSPVPEGTEADEKGHTDSGANGVVGGSERAKYESAMASLAQATNERNASMAERERLQNENNQLMVRMRDIESRAKGGAGVGVKGAPKAGADGAFSLLHLIIAVFFAFILGRYT